MAQHLETPWKVYERSVAIIHIESEKKVGWGIAEVQIRADADFIVKCVNSHDELVEALKECNNYLANRVTETHKLMTDQVDYLFLDSKKDELLLKQVKQALAQAKEA